MAERVRSVRRLGKMNANEFREWLEQGCPIHEPAIERLKESGFKAKGVSEALGDDWRGSVAPTPDKKTEPETWPCEYCEGTGEDRASGELCRECKGHGRARKCKGCGGTGHTKEGRYCEACDETGMEPDTSAPIKRPRKEGEPRTVDCPECFGERFKAEEGKGHRTKCGTCDGSGRVDPREVEEATLKAGPRSEGAKARARKRHIEGLGKPACPGCRGKGTVRRSKRSGLAIECPTCEGGCTQKAADDVAARKLKAMEPTSFTERFKEVECRACEGAGISRHKGPRTRDAVKCGACDGEGVIMLPKCEACDGRGRMVSGAECEPCTGTGIEPESE
jgi:DnaJ-class molecular chaperone